LLFFGYVFELGGFGFFCGKAHPLRMPRLGVVRRHRKESILDQQAGRTEDLAGGTSRTFCGTRRRATGEILIASGVSLLGPGGEVVYGKELVPEIELRWVGTPAEECMYRRVAFEITVAGATEKVAAVWERRAHVDIRGKSYVFLVTSPLVAATGCGAPGTWLVVQDGFLTPTGR
jgi:hypothetical protein